MLMPAYVTAHRPDSRHEGMMMMMMLLCDAGIMQEVKSRHIDRVEEVEWISGMPFMRASAQTMDDRSREVTKGEFPRIGHEEKKY